MQKIILLISLIIASSFAHAQPPIHITFLNPGISNPNNPTGKFWLSVSAFMQAAADDLNINLEVIYSERDRFLMQKQATAVLSRETLPDYIVVVNEKDAAGKIIKEADLKGLKTFVMLNTFTGDQANLLGKPREKHPHWIGHLIPNNVQAGYTQAKQLINERRQYDSIIEAVAIGGDKVTQAAKDRLTGFYQAVEESPNVIVKQVLHARWRRDLAKEKTRVVLKRYPSVDIIWTANDPSALGVIEAIKEVNKLPGKDILVGGLNWDKEIFEKLHNKEVQVSLGGHFMTGAWSLVLLHDYHKGIDFMQQRGRFATHTEFSSLDAQTINRYEQLFTDQNWSKIDFKQFSKFYNKEIADYDFSSQAIYRQFLPNTN